MRKIVAGKLHGIHVTEANLNYHGSITLDPDHCEAARIMVERTWISPHDTIDDCGQQANATAVDAEWKSSAKHQIESGQQHR